jgi:hypothetical protein
MALILMSNKIKTAIPDRQERQHYVDSLIKGLTVTCDNCEYRFGCDHNYQDCQFNPANEEN